MQVGDLVECPRLGTGIFTIVSETHNHFVLEQNGKKSPIFKVHCHQSLDLKFKSVKNRNMVRKDRAEKIGRVNTPKSGDGYYD